MSQQNTAILIFANTPEQEIRDKSFGKNLSKTRQLRLAQAMLSHTRRVAKSTGLPIIEILSSQQQGDNFAQRYTHAIAQVFAQGYQRIISIGTDCPDLQSQDIVEAHLKLQQSNSVLGLARDGGAYLVAFRRAYFDTQQFQDLPWQTTRTAAALEQYFESFGSNISFLATHKTDVDNFAQLLHALGEMQTHSVVFLIICQLLSINRPASIGIFILFHPLYLGHFSGLRAPPSY